VFASGNFFNDAPHHFRHNNLHRDLDIYIYANRFFEPSSGGKHVHLSPDTSQITNARVWVYQNSFAGRGWAVDVGFEGTPPNLPNVHVLNNLISTDGLTSGPSPNGWEVAKNYFDNLWYGNTIPTFVLPVGHPARDSAPSLIPRGLPGMTTTYYQDGRPDIGAIQGTSQSTMLPPTRLRATIK
jgi:hypothetical protein